MALDKTGLGQNIGQIKPLSGVDAPKAQQNPADLAKASADFRKALDSAQGDSKLGTKLGQLAGLMTPTGGMPAAPAAEGLKFSNHAVERMRSRGINFPADEMADIQNAVAKAAAKGSKDTLVLSGENALIVSVKNNTVVTVMDRAAMKNNVFTNIDSTVVI